MKNRVPSIWSGILRYSAAIIAIAVALGLYKNGLRFWEGWRPEGVMAALIFIPLGAAVMWMRWEWASFVAKQRKQG